MIYYVPLIAYAVAAYFFIWALLRAAAKPVPRRGERPRGNPIFQD